MELVWKAVSAGARARPQSANPRFVRSSCTAHCAVRKCWGHVRSNGQRDL